MRMASFGHTALRCGVLMLALHAGLCDQDMDQNTCDCTAHRLHFLRIASPPDLSVVSGPFREFANCILRECIYWWSMYVCSDTHALLVLRSSQCLSKRCSLYIFITWSSDSLVSITPMITLSSCAGLSVSMQTAFYMNVYWWSMYVCNDPCMYVMIHTHFWSFDGT